MKIIKVKYCNECPLNKRANGISFCSHKKHKQTSGRIFTNIEFTDGFETFPKWCGLPDKPKK